MAGVQYKIYYVSLKSDDAKKTIFLSSHEVTYDVNGSLNKIYQSYLHMIMIIFIEVEDTNMLNIKIDK